MNTLAHKVKSKVEALDKENDRAKAKKGQGEGSASERTRTTISAGLKKKLKDLMGEFSELRNRITEEYREVVERRVFTVTGGFGWVGGWAGGPRALQQTLVNHRGAEDGGGLQDNITLITQSC